MRGTSILILLLGICGSVSAAATPAQTIAPFVNDQTSGVGYLDLSRTDVETTEKWLQQAIQGLGDAPDIAALPGHLLGPSRPLRNDMVGAGGHEFFVIAEGFPPEPIYFVVPLRAEADADAISGLLISGKADGPAAQHGWTAKVFSNAVVSGRDADVQALEQRETQARPELADALAGDAPIRIALIPSEQLRQSVEQKQQRGVQPPGGRPMAKLARSFRWGSLSLKTPPEPSLRLLVQAENPQAAAEIQTVWDELNAKGLRAVQGGLPVEPRSLKPAIQKDQLVLELNSQQLQKLIQAIAPALVSARQNAVRVQAMSNIRQLLVAGIMHANENKGQWPDDLESLVGTYLKADAILKNPRDPENGSFAYIKPPANWNKTPAQTRVVIYEEIDPMPALIHIGFADGHVEAMAAQAAMILIEQAAGDEGEAQP